METTLKRWFGWLLVWTVALMVVFGNAGEAAKKKRHRQPSRAELIRQMTPQQREQLRVTEEGTAFLRGMVNSMNGPAAWRNQRIARANRKLRPKEQALYSRASGRIVFILNAMKGYASLFPASYDSEQRKITFEQRRRIAIDFPNLIAPAVSPNFRRNWEKKDNRLDVLNQLGEKNLGQLLTNGRLDLSKCGERDFDFKTGRNRISFCSIEETTSVFFDCDQKGKINNISFEHYAVD